MKKSIAFLITLALLIGMLSSFTFIGSAETATVAEGASASLSALTANIVRGEIHITAKAQNATTYTLYTRGAGATEWTFNSTTTYPVIVAAYNAANEYGVSVTGTDGVESAVMLVENFAQTTNLGYNPANFFTQFKFVPTAAALATVHGDARRGYPNLTDGTINDDATRFSTKVSAADCFDATITFDAAYTLGELRIFDFNASNTSAAFVGTYLTIQILVDGVWETLYDNIATADLLKYRAYYTVAGKSFGYLGFDMGGKSATALRIYVPNRVGSNSISLWQIECSGTKSYTGAGSTVEMTNLFSGKQFTPNITHSVSGGTPISNLTDGSGAYFRITSGLDITLSFDNSVALLDTLSMQFGFNSAADGSRGRYRCGEDLFVYAIKDGKETLIYHEQFTNYISKNPIEIALDSTSSSSVEGFNGKKGIVTFDLKDENGNLIEAEAIRIKNSGPYKGNNGHNGDPGVTPYYTDLTEIYEISCSGSITYNHTKNYSDNIFADVEFVPTTAALNSVFTRADGYFDYGYKTLTDGVINTSNVHANRYSSTGNYPTFDATASFPSVRYIDDLYLHVFDSKAEYMGQIITIEVHHNGKWTKLYNELPNAEAAKLLVDVGGRKAIALPIDSYCDAIRIYTYGRVPYLTADGKTNYYSISFFEITATGGYDYDDYGNEDVTSNAFANMQASQLSCSESVHSGFPLTNAFDGNTSSRWSVSNSVGNDPYSVTIDLGYNMPLYNLSIWEYRDGTEKVNGEKVSRSDKTKIEVFVTDRWVPVIVDQPLDPENSYTTFNLRGITTSKVRITFDNPHTFDGGASKTYRATIFEIKCTTAADRKAMLEAYKGFETITPAEAMGMDTIVETNRAEFLSFLGDTTADANTIADYTATIKARSASLAKGAPTTTAFGNFSSYNLTLNGDIGFNFYGDFEGVSYRRVLESFPNAKVVIVDANGNVTETPLASLPKDDTLSKVTSKITLSVTLAAAEMTDKVQIRVVFDGGNCTEVIEQSVADYAKDILADETYASSHALIKSMLNYGAYAQTYFGYNTDSLANSVLAPEDTVLPSVTEESKVTLNGAATGLNLKTWNLTLETQVQAKLFFTLEEGASLAGYTATVATPSGVLNTVELAEDENRAGVYYILVEDITPAFLNDNYTITITNTTDSSAVTFQFSAMCYVATILNTSANTNLVNLVTALKLYSVAAENYN